jgi:hypothetical protein
MSPISIPSGDPVILFDGAEKLLELSPIGEKKVGTKYSEEIVVLPPTVIEIGPYFAPVGTFTTSCIEVAPVTVARAEPKKTKLLLLSASKLLPEIMTVEPGSPARGENLAIDGIWANRELVVKNINETRNPILIIHSFRK